jgi:F0F1-type ATP synthase assembly protein I
MPPQPDKNNDGNGWEMFARYSGLAILLPASTFVGYLIGYGLDHLLSTHFLKIVFLVLGTIGGFIDLIREILGK